MSTIVYRKVTTYLVDVFWGREGWGPATHTRFNINKNRAGHVYLKVVGGARPPAFVIKQTLEHVAHV